MDSKISYKIFQDLVKTKKFIQMSNRTIFLTDLTASTHYRDKYGPNRGYAKAVIHNTISKEVIEDFGGLYLKSLGDGVLAVFSDPLQAAQAGIDIMNMIESYNKTVPKKSSVDKIQTKIAITSGYLHEYNEDNTKDYLGSAIDKAARILAHAKSNQILVDESVAEQLRPLRATTRLDIGKPVKITLGGLPQASICEIGRTNDIRGIEEKICYQTMTVHPLRTDAYEYLKDRLPEKKVSRIDLLQFSGDTSKVVLQAVADKYPKSMIRLLLMNRKLAEKYDEPCFHRERIDGTIRAVEVLAEDHKDLTMGIWSYNTEPGMSVVLVDNLIASIGWYAIFKKNEGSSKTLSIRGHSMPCITARGSSVEPFLSVGRLQFNRILRGAKLEKSFGPRTKDLLIDLKDSKK